MRFDPESYRRNPAIADGGWSTILAEHGLPPDSPLAEMMNLHHEVAVRGLARAYVEAGAEIITTNTFCGNAIALSRRGVEADIQELNRAGAAICRSVAGDTLPVLGSLGPTGAIVAVNEVPEDQIMAAFRVQAQGLVEGGVDGFVLETFSEIGEAVLAIRAIREETDLPVVASFSFDSGPQRTRTMTGAEAAACAAAVEDAGAALIGCNCGAGVATYLPIVVALRAASTLPIWVRPSGGLPDLVDDRATYTTTPEDYVRHAAPLLEAGANIIGGCCGVGPAHIQRLAALVQRRRT